MKTLEWARGSDSAWLHRNADIPKRITVHAHRKVPNRCRRSNDNANSDGARFAPSKPANLLVPLRHCQVRIWRSFGITLSSTALLVAALAQTKSFLSESDLVCSGLAVHQAWTTIWSR